MSVPSGAVCSPSCMIPPNDPVILPENVTTDTLEHWMEPVKVQVRRGTFLCSETLRLLSSSPLTAYSLV